MQTNRSAEKQQVKNQTEGGPRDGSGGAVRDAISAAAMG
jgi:hypothetical protein